MDLLSCYLVFCRHNLLKQDLNFLIEQFYFVAKRKEKIVNIYSNNYT